MCAKLELLVGWAQVQLQRPSAGVLLSEEEPRLCHLVGDEDLELVCLPPTLPSRKRSLVGLPKKASAVLLSIRPSTMTCATCTFFGPYSRAMDWVRQETYLAHVAQCTLCCVSFLRGRTRCGKGHEPFAATNAACGARDQKRAALAMLLHLAQGQLCKGKEGETVSGSVHTRSPRCCL